MGPAPKGSKAEENGHFRIVYQHFIVVVGIITRYTGIIKMNTIIVCDVSHLVVQEMDRGRRCLGRLYVAWTGQTTPHCWAGVALQTSPLGGQWLWLQAVERKDTGSSFHPHRGQEGPLPPAVPAPLALPRVGRVFGGLCRHWSADATGRASHRRRARSRHGGHHVLRVAGLALQIEIEEKKQLSWRW